MRVAVHQVDGSMPNCALMQIAKHHEDLGHSVERFKGDLFASEYDIIYHSKIFKFSPMPYLHEQSIIGGTGIDFRNTLPKNIAMAGLSYTQYPDCDYHIGFTSKGCRFRCEFCCVPSKEGKPRHNATLDGLLSNPNGGRKLMLLDNDFFGNKDWRGILSAIIDRDLLVCFAQGLNIRLITSEQASLLAKVKFRNTKFNQKYVTFAWDKYADREKIMSGIKRCNESGIDARQMQFFVLIGFDTTPEQDLQRVEELRNLGALPFVMPYNRQDRYQREFSRWVNNRAIFKTVTFKEYRGACARELIEGSKQ